MLVLPYIVCRMKVSLTSLFHMLSDLTRLRCVVLMAREGELCVCELTHALQQIQPKISRHLALLRETGLVSTRRQGQWIFYRIHPDLPPWGRQIIEAAVEGSADQPPFQQDRERLTKMSGRPLRCCD